MTITIYTDVDASDWANGQVIELDNAPETVVSWYTDTLDSPQQMATIRLQAYDDMPPIWWVRIYNWRPKEHTLELIVEDELGMHLPWRRSRR